MVTSRRAVKIGIDTHAAEQDRSGNGTYIRGLVRALAGLRNDAEYVLYALDPRHPFYAELHDRPGVTVRPLWPRRAMARIPLALALASHRDRLDALHVQYVGPPWHRGALVVTIHDLAFLRLPRSFPPLQALRLRWQVPVNARRAAAIITVSEHSRRDLHDAYGIAPDKVAVIPLATDAAPVRDRAAVDAARRAFGITHPYVLCVGRLNARKNLVGLLHAFERVRARLAEPAQLVIAGPRDYRADELDRAIAASPHGRDVLRVGYVSDAQLPALLSGCAVFAYPSLFEGFGLPPLEAMACGAPVICSGVTSLPEVVGDAALTFDPTSVDDIAAAMLAVLSDEGLRASLIERGRQRAGRFDWPRAAAHTLDVYRQAARHPSPASATS
jgi:glycosyltransferase involved in cell wall biosynthesis